MHRLIVFPHLNVQIDNTQKVLPILDISLKQSHETLRKTNSGPVCYFSPDYRHFKDLEEDLTKPVHFICEQKRYRSASAYAQTDRRRCYPML